MVIFSLIYFFSFRIKSKVIYIKKLTIVQTKSFDMNSQNTTSFFKIFYLGYINLRYIFYRMLKLPIIF